MISKHENSDCFIEAGTGNSPMLICIFIRIMRLFFRGGRAGIFCGR